MKMRIKHCGSMNGTLTYMITTVSSKKGTMRINMIHSIQDLNYIVTTYFTNQQNLAVKKNDTLEINGCFNI